MSTCSSFVELPEQLGYVQCSFCTTILLVSVPCSSLLKVVTVRCGHCTGLLSVSLVRTSLVPLQLLASLGNDEEKHEETGDVPRRAYGDGDDEEDNEKESPPKTPVVNKPPEKRQRAPSAYNRFIKEEIQRIKAKEPNITHKEAFSTAAKNWAHFPRAQHKGDGESCSMGGEENTTYGEVASSTDPLRCPTCTVKYATMLDDHYHKMNGNQMMVIECCTVDGRSQGICKKKTSR